MFINKQLMVSSFTDGDDSQWGYLTLREQRFQLHQIKHKPLLNTVTELKFAVCVPVPVFSDVYV